MKSLRSEKKPICYDVIVKDRSLAHKTEERSIDVTFLNGDLLTVTGEKREEGNVRYLINLDTKTNKTFYGTKEGTSPWVME